MKSVGITGPPGSGKTLLWQAISGGGAKGDIAAVDVPEPRLDKLVELHQSRSRVASKVEIVDVHATARTSAAAIAKLREFDALLAVLPAFGGQDPVPHLADLRDEFLLADMAPIDTRLARAKKDSAAKKEIPALEAAYAQLESGTFLRDREWTKEELSTFAAFAPLTLKPIIVVFNVDEDGIGHPAPDESLPSFVASAALESEVSGLDDEEAKDLLQAYGVDEPVLGRMVHGVYRSLDLITFFTTSDKESRAWEVRRGATAPEAAGAIHSDLQRGFIRAEVVGYDKLIEAGSWDAAKAKSLIRVEGKDYVFQEADVTHFRFAV